MKYEGYKVEVWHTNRCEYFANFNTADACMRTSYGAVYCRITEEETVWYGPSNPADNHSIGPVIGWHDNKGQPV